MSLLLLIVFRHLDTQLSDDEFFNQFTKSVGRELITKLLFNHFNSNPSQISTITNIQSGIITKREENQQILPYDCIDAFPSEIINECGSYLHYKEYYRLAKCNRKTYIACFASPKIQELDLNLFIRSRSESIHFNAFKNIGKLSMYINVFNALSASKKRTWSNNDSLHTLELRNTNNHETLSFINQHLINYNAITTLILYCFTPELIQALASNLQFTQIQTLELRGIKLSADYHSKLIEKTEIKKWFPFVKRLIIYGSSHNAIFPGIIEALHNEIESLKVVNINAAIPSNITYPKLQSVELRYPNDVIFLKKMPETLLKHVSLICDCENIIITAFIENTICKQLALEHVTFGAVGGNPLYILQQLESVLIRNRNKPKCKRLRIGVLCHSPDVYKFIQSNTHTAVFGDDKKEFGVRLFRVSNALKVSNIDNWCLEIAHKGTRNNFDKEYLENELNEMKRNYYVNYQITQTKLTVIVSNCKEMSK